MAKQPKVIENEELIKEWNWEKNNELGFNPNKLTCGSWYNVWWKCKEGHEYLRTIKNQRDAKNNGLGLCKRCLLLKTNLATEYPLLSQQWLFEKNKGCPSDYSPHSSAVVWWKCEKGHEWQASVSHRSSGRRCPKCFGESKTSFPEQAIFFYYCSKDICFYDKYNLKFFLPTHVLLHISTILLCFLVCQKYQKPIPFSHFFCDAILFLIQDE